MTPRSRKHPMPDLTTEVEEKLRLTKKDRSLADQNVSVVFIVEKVFLCKAELLYVYIA